MRYSFTFLFILCFLFSFGQEESKNLGSLTGNFQSDAQYYQDDEKIGSVAPDQKLASNSYLTLNYRYNKFSAGVRAETYLPPLQGYDQRYEGTGFPYRFIRYSGDQIQITAGNIYEQFGNGLVLRTYQDWGLGFDNSIDGIGVRYKLGNGFTAKGIIGKQRFFFDKGPGIIRGLDLEWNINEVVDSLKTQYKMGISGVSKFQEDADPIYNLPENVATLSGRISIQGKTFSLNSEYAYKYNDPSFTNENSYQNGKALLINASYFKSGFTASLNIKRIDNFDFRSDRTATGNDLLINYLPSLSINYTNRLFSLYPYVTQPLGEFGTQGEISYNFKKKTKLGGKYGTFISANYTRIHDIERHQLDSPLQYESGLFDISDKVLYQAFSIEISKKFNKRLKNKLIYQYFESDNSVLLVADFKGTIAGHITVLETNYKISSNQSLKLELQSLLTSQDQGDWATLQLEYTIFRKWFINFLDDYNYGNPNGAIHYATVGGGFHKGSTRIIMSYGRQRAGVLCVGGICRLVPATNGFSLSLSKSF